MADLSRSPWNFTFRQLNTFVCAARAGSFARAAEQLGVSQPAISSCIAILENRLERTLFQRRPGARPMLTRDGRDLLDMAEALLDASEGIRGGDDRQLQRKQRVRLCIGPMLRDIYLKPILPDLYRDHPDIELDLVPIIPLDDIQSQLDKGRVDLIVYTIGRSVDAWPNVRLVGQVPLVMVGPPGIGQRLARGDVSMDDLPYILPSSNRLSEHWIERQLALQGIKPSRPIIYLDFPDVIQDMVANHLGVSVLMQEQVERAVREGQLEIFGPALPTMQRVILRSPLAQPAATQVEAYLMRSLQGATAEAQALIG